MSCHCNNCPRSWSLSAFTIFDESLLLLKSQLHLSVLVCTCRSCLSVVSVDTSPG
jgi:hypothetical protein